MRRFAAVLAAGLVLTGCSGPPEVPPPAAATSAAPSFAGTRVERDLAYAGTSPAQRLDLYLPSGPGPFPLVMNIHGGGWLFGDKADPQELWNVEQLTGRGVAVASINYRLSGEARFPAGVQDAKAAVRWLRANSARLGLDGDRIAVTGASAGGHLAALVGITGSSLTNFDAGDLGNEGTPAGVRAVVSVYGVTDLLTMDAQAEEQGCPGPWPVADAPDSPEAQWLGYPIQDRPEEARTSTVTTYLKQAKDVPPFYLVHGTADCTVAFAQSETLQKALRRKGVEVTLQPVEGAGHGDPKVFEAGTDAAIEFLTRALR